MGKASLPPGFRFSPTDVELVKYYLKRKLMRKRLHVNLIAEVDIYKYAPWDLPDKACWRSGDLKWYFFCPREKKYANGARMNRGTECGYWKTTGKDRNVLYSGEVVGWIKTLIFHTGRAPRGERTDWVMHEYRLDDKHMADRGVPQDSYVLCKIFQKDGPGPRIGAQYGAPFKEEDWTDDEVEICSEALPNANMPEPALAHPNNFNSSIAAGTHSPEGIPMGPSESCVSDLLSPSSMVLQPVSSDYVTLEKRHVSTGDDIMASSMVLQPVSSDYVTLEKHHVSTGDDITAMLNCFTEENGLFMIENYKNEELGNLIHPGNANVIPHFNTSDIYKDLGDLGNLARFSEDGYNFSSGHDSTMYTVDQTLAGDNGSFLELVDLDKPINCQSDMYTEHPPMFGQPHTLPGETPFGFVNHENMFKMNFGNY